MASTQVTKEELARLEGKFDEENRFLRKLVDKVAELCARKLDGIVEVVNRNNEARKSEVARLQRMIDVVAIAASRVEDDFVRTLVAQTHGVTKEEMKHSLDGNVTALWLANDALANQQEGREHAAQKRERVVKQLSANVQRDIKEMSTAVQALELELKLAKKTLQDELQSVKDKTAIHTKALTVALEERKKKRNKTSPNAKCPCGSGKKFKRCCKN